MKRSKPTKDLRLEQAKREIAAVNKALKLGHPPTSSSRYAQSAPRVACEALKQPRQSFTHRVGSPKAPGMWHRAYGLAPDWALYVPPVPEAPSIVPSEAPEDPVTSRRMSDENKRLRNAVADLERRIGDAQDYRSSILGLAKEPLKPKFVYPTGLPSQITGRTVILHISDVHYGETVNIDEMDGANKYDASIARARLGRLFAKGADLMTEFWKGEPPDEIIVALGGDLISGDIHLELMNTNEPAVPATVREVGERIAGGILLLRQKVGVPIRVLSVPGNHGRLSLKPQSKRRAANSLDLLATDFAEAALRGSDKGITFYQTASPDAYFSAYGFHFCLTHGDAMGSKGGQGYIGPGATIIRGHRKLIDTSWRSGRPVHYVLTGHLHTTLRTPFGYANGSVVGYSEYARDLRADPEAARQNMLVVHKTHGVINHQELHLGVPSEGTLYAGPSSIIRPTYEEAT